MGYDEVGAKELVFDFPIGVCYTLFMTNDEENSILASDSEYLDWLKARESYDRDAWFASLETSPLIGDEKL